MRLLECNLEDVAVNNHYYSRQDSKNAQNIPTFLCCYLIAVRHEGQVSERIVEGLDNQSVIGAIAQRGQIIVSKL